MLIVQVVIMMCLIKIKADSCQLKLLILLDAFP